MALLSFTTELDAVNAMLASIGQSPVPTLDDLGIEDANRARDTLRGTTRAVLARGYDFNTDEDYSLSPDVSGLIRVPPGVLEIDATDKLARIVIRRHPSANAMCLWDKAAQSWEFSGPVKCDIVWGFPFEDLPEIARAYITASAARQFQQNTVGAQILDRYAAEDEAELLAELIKRETRSRDANILRDSVSISAMTNNRRY